jgi:transcription elongation factor GreA
MLDKIRELIDDEIGRLSHELNVELPKAIEKALEHGDLRENADYKAAKERQQFVQARIGHLQQRMSELSKIDVKQMPHDRVGFGSKVKVFDYQLNEEVNFTIVAAEFMDWDKGDVSIASPIGRGLLNAKLDDEVTVNLPVGARRYKVLELVTLPQQLGMAKAK